MNDATLEQLLMQARKARDDAGRMLADERLGQQQLLTHIELLRTYRLEYAMNLQQAMSQGVTAVTLRDYQSFLVSLDQAVQQGEDSLEDKERRVQQAQATWREKQKRLDAFDALRKRRQQLQMQLEGRRDQRSTDELSSQFVARERLKQQQLAQELLS
jgi:flagellar FliJ protein